MPIVNGNYYMNGDYGQGLEQAKIADGFPGLADQTGSGDSWADQLVDHLTTPRSATEPPPAPAPPGMPPEAYDDMKVNQLTVRQVANIVANEDRDVTPGTSSADQLKQSKLWKAPLSTRIKRMAISDMPLWAQLRRKSQPAWKLLSNTNRRSMLHAKHFKNSFRERTRPAAGCGSTIALRLQPPLVFSIPGIRIFPVSA
jgi:hypothetical protein